MSRHLSKFDLLFSSFKFLKEYWRVPLALGLIAAFGRVAQLGGFGQISSSLNILLEIVVETSRVLIFLFVLGIANLQRAYNLVKKVLMRKVSIKNTWSGMFQVVRIQWAGLVLSLIGFLLIAGAINLLIDQVAYQTCLLLSLKDRGILVPDSSEWTILLFFKNILVIPFTIVFETLLLLWITSHVSIRRSTA